MGQSKLHGLRFPDVQRRYQSTRIREGTPAHDALEELKAVTYPTGSYERWTGEPGGLFEMYSDASPELARSIFAGLRPEMWSRSQHPDIGDAERYGRGNRLEPSGVAHPMLGLGSLPSLPPVPPDFTPSPLIPSQDAAKLFAEYAAINPEIRRTIKEISMDPLLDWEDAPYGKVTSFPYTPDTSTSRGGPAADVPYRTMWLNPLSGNRNKDEMASTMGHELGHVLVNESQTPPGLNISLQDQHISEETANRVDALLRRLGPSGGRGGRIPFSLRLEDIR